MKGIADGAIDAVCASESDGRRPGRPQTIHDTIFRQIFHRPGGDTMTVHRSSPRLVGWREWAALPDLHVPRIKAKLDTGAWTSVIHAWNVQAFDKEGREWVRFALHPQQRDSETSIQCEAPLADRRKITSSNGHSERRYIIETLIDFGTEAWPIELGLTDRDEMGFRLLIGRAAMRGRFIVDPESSFRLGRPLKAAAKPAAKTSTPRPKSRGK